MSYRIVTDTCCDFPQSMYEELDLSVVPLSVNFQGQAVSSYSEQWLKDMFAGLRAGETASTSAVNPTGWQEVIEPVVKSGEDVLVLAFSSGLSTTYQSAVIAASELMETYPDRTIRVVDTLCASLGQGLLVYYACQKRDAGLSLDDLTNWCEERKYNLCHWFTVDDLMYLKRGGRVSAATALVGTMLQIKPVLHVDDQGHLINVSKTRGRKASIEALAKKMGELGLPGENDTVFICHGDCMEDAQHLEKLVKELYGVKNVMIYYVGAVIGSHSGPGTLALFFLGKNR
ncbi:MAG: DegV family protein [Oscillospiraceae bacterium]|nr:DegV family protein [Oscillospiraceae bacterium]